ncbi:MAG: metallophosphoesterase [Cyanobacteria bacterium J06600_6]
MKRRKLLSLSALGGLGIVLGGHSYLSFEYPLTYRSCPKFRTRSSAKLLSNFVVMGDVGTGGNGQYKVAKTMSCFYAANPFPLVLMTGDNIYSHGDIDKIKDTFETPYQELLQQQVKFYAALGNHDTDNFERGAKQIEYADFNMGGRYYYTFTDRHVQFFALDTNFSTPLEEQFEWLETELQQSKQPWKVVFGHHPIYSSGRHGGSSKLIERLPPLFARYGVQLYLNGHDHHYERTKPINGTTYITCGNGAQLRKVGKSDWTAYAVSRLGFAAVEVYSDRLEILGIGTNGEIFDRGEIMISQN